jgi:FAD/FMN-containing dehydrogenase
LHPLICFDSRFPDEVKRVRDAGSELMQVCVSAGGTITGEHGVGLDKRELLPLVFSEADMNCMLRVRAAFDPLGLCNPGKIIPMLRGCGEARAVSSEAPKLNSDAGDFVRRSQSAPQQKQRDFTTNTAANVVGSIVGDQNLKVVDTTVIVHPASVAEISEVMHLAECESWTVRPAGSMSWLTDVSSSNLVISTSRLIQIIEHEPADLIAITQAGVPLSTFNAELSKNGQWLPLDPPDDGRASIGGVVATGLGGAQQMAYGRPRGSVIGMKVVLADGGLVKVGGRVVKNVSGYDLCKLFSGSYGTLGIITELNFKLRPRPASEQTIIVHGPPVELIRQAQRVLESKLFPVALELVSAALARHLGVATKNDQTVLLLRFAGNKKGVEFQTREAVGRFAEASCELVDDDTSLWISLAAVPLNESPALSWRASTLPALLPKLIESLTAIYKSSFAESLWQIGIGDGRMRMIENADSGYTDSAAKAVRQLRGYFVIEDSHLDLTSTGLMSRVKAELDPGGVFIT